MNSQPTQPVAPPAVSIVLPTYNRLDRLKQVIAALERQDYPLDDFELIVVSDGSTDGTHEYLAQLDTPLRLQVAIQPNSGPAAARNLGVSRATAEIVLFIDDDVVPAPQLVSEHLRVHRTHGGDVVVLGPMLNPPDFAMKPWVRWEQAMLAKQYTAMIEGHWEPTARQFYTGNTSLARRHIVDAGGFDTAFRRAEDVELAYRLAVHHIRFVFNPLALGYHYAERSFRSWMETPYAYGKNDVIFARDKAQGWILPKVHEEFRQRNRLIQLLVSMCLGRRALSAGAMSVLQAAARLGEQIHVEQLYRLAFSAIFNLRYYEGFADELGGRSRFMSYIR